MRIVDLDRHDTKAIEETAALIFEAFKEGWPEAWPDMKSALEEVNESFGEGRISRVAIDDAGTVVGWIGGISEYDGLVWELHPLAVSPQHQRQGIGSALVADFEQQVRARGALTIMLGSDDDSGMTTLSGVDLYSDVWGHISRIRNLGGHPFEFYQKLGYVIVGVVPDANGVGKPDIIMAKRVGG